MEIIKGYEKQNIAKMRYKIYETVFYYVRMHFLTNVN